MKKRVIFIGMVAFVVMIVCFNSRSFIQSVRNFDRNKIEYSENDITIVDITNLNSNISIEHEHVYKTTYNENKHWEECIVCGEKNNEIVHALKTTWSSGSESCQRNNFYTKTCSCGYSYTGHKPCVWDGKTYSNNLVGKHTKTCSVHGSYILYSYYLNKYGNGEIYDISEDFGYEDCTSSNGTKLNCNNPGTCVKCKNVISSSEHAIIADEITGKISCYLCGKEYGTFTYERICDGNAPATYTWVSKVDLISGNVFSKKWYN